MATISNVNGKKITKIKYKGEIYDTGGGDPLKEYLDETKDASYMFCGQAYLVVSSANTTWYSNLTYERLQKILSYNTTSSVTNMKGMFSNCNNLTAIPLINTSLVTDMNNMFSNCSRLSTIPQFDMSKVTNMQQMFANCALLSTIPQLNTSKVKNMSNIFGNCYELITIPLLDTSSATDMSYMFYECHKLTTINITHMKITSTSKTNGFAYNCYSLTKLIIRNMTTLPVLASSAFDSCYHFTGTTDATYNPQGLKDGRIYVPDDKVEALKTATNWSVYADIIVPLSTLVE